MRIMELSLIYDWIKITYTSTLWRLGAKLITFSDSGHTEVGIEVAVGPITLWVGYIGRGTM